MKKSTEFDINNFMKNFEKNQKNMMLKEQCDFISQGISLINLRPDYDFFKKNQKM